MGTDIHRVAAVADIAKRAGAYAMRGEQVDGMDVLKVFDVVKDCADYVRSGKGPVLVEALTYRFRGHSMADPATYRDKAELEEERKRDPIPRLRDYLLKSKKFTEAELTEVEQNVKVVVDQAVKFADSSPEPSLEELQRDTLVEPDEEDVKPRERVLGVRVTSWPEYPSPGIKVTWELEPKPTREQKAG
jgi:pyruvate dehydrogenase E1 component alpha subunit